MWALQLHAGRITRGALLKGMAAAGIATLSARGATGWAAAPFDLGTITITWHPIFLYSLPTMAAIKQRFMDEEEIEIKDIIGAKGGATTMHNMVDGNLRLGEPAAAAGILSIWDPAEGTRLTRKRNPFTIVGGGTKDPGDISWVVLKESPIRSVRDLEGKTMSFTSPQSVTDELSGLIVRRQHLGNVKRIPAGGIGEGLALLRKGDVQACAMLEPVFSLEAAKLGSKFDLRILFFAREFVPNYFQTFILVQDSLKDVKIDGVPVITRFLRARARGVRWIRENLDTAAALYANENGLATGIGRRVLQASNVKEAYWSDGRFNAGGLNVVEEAMLMTGELPPGARVPWSSLIDQRFLEPVQVIRLPR